MKIRVLFSALVVACVTNRKENILDSFNLSNSTIVSLQKFSFAPQTILHGNGIAGI